MHDTVLSTDPLRRYPIPPGVNLVQHSPSNVSPARLLIVEDDPVMQLGLSELFEENPQFQIVGQVADGYTAVDLALKLQPNLIIMDIGLPKLEGIAAIQRIKAALSKVRVVMLTSHQCAAL